MQTLEGFGARLRAEREKAGLSQEALAQAAVLNKETIYRIERGHDTKVATITKLRRVLPGIDHQMPQQDGVASGRNRGVDDEYAAITKRIHGLVRGIGTMDRLQRVRTFLIQMLVEEDAEPQPVIGTIEIKARLDGVQHAAETRLLARQTRRAHKTTV